MDRLTLSRIDEELGSSEVAALCFLCMDFINKKRLEGIVDAKGLFRRLEEKGLENHCFLSELLHTIRRADLVKLLETDSRQLEETDANPTLSSYRLKLIECDHKLLCVALLFTPFLLLIVISSRVMLYRIYEEMTNENFEKMQFLLSSKLGRRPTEMCKSALDLFIEMEKNELLSNSRLDILRDTLLEMDQELVSILNRYKPVMGQRQRHNQRSSHNPQSVLISRGSCPPPSCVGETVFPDAEAMPSPDPEEYYTLTHNPRGLCVVFNNEEFEELPFRNGTQQDVDSLQTVFSSLGFNVIVHKNLTASAMRDEINGLSGRNFTEHDALVVCILSHGDLGSVYGIDEKKVLLQHVTQPFTSRNAPTLAGKPKMFFIQACQGNDFQFGYLPDGPGPFEQGDIRQNQLQEDAGPAYSKTVASSADFLVGMATVPHCKSFRNSSTGSIYIQELCYQLRESAKRADMDDILSVLTRVNRNVSNGIYRGYKQMPEPKYTFTKKLVLKPV